MAAAAPPYRITRRDGRWRISIAGEDVLDCTCYGKAIECVTLAAAMLARPALPTAPAPCEAAACSHPPVERQGKRI